MKITQALSASLLITLALLSCKQKNESLSSETKTEIEPIEFSPKTLSFTSEEQMYEMVSSISQMSVEQKKQWYAQYPDFTSMEAAKSQVVEQMSKCGTYDEAVKLKNVYSELFIFNQDLAEGDVSPYYPMDESYYAMVCNAYGNAEIAGKTVCYNNIKSYDDTWCAKLSKRTQSSVTRTGREEFDNYLHAWTDNRKMWVRAIKHDNTNEVWVEVGAQQKICFLFCAWHAYNNEFTFAPASIGQSGEVTYIPSNNIFYQMDVRKLVFPDIMMQDGTQIRAFRMNQGHVLRGYRIYSQGVGSDNAGILKIVF